jgi:hypothetical protein
MNYTSRVEFERLFDIGRIYDSHCEAAAIIGPGSNDIHWRGFAAGVDFGLLAAGRVTGFCLGRIARYLNRDCFEVVVANSAGKPVGSQAELETVFIAGGGGD